MPSNRLLRGAHRAPERALPTSRSSGKSGWLDAVPAWLFPALYFSSRACSFIFRSRFVTTAVEEAGFVRVATDATATGTATEDAAEDVAVELPVDALLGATVDAPQEAPPEAPVAALLVAAPVAGPGEATVEAPMGALVDAPVRELVAGTVEASVEEPAEAAVEALVEALVEAPVEAPVEETETAGWAAALPSPPLTAAAGLAGPEPGVRDP